MAAGSPSGKRRRRMRTLSASWTGPRMMPMWQGNWLPSACWSRRPCRFRLAPTLVFSMRQSRPSAGPRWWGESMEDESFSILELNTRPQTVVVILSLSSNLLGPRCSPEWVGVHQEGYREGDLCQRAAREWNHGKASGPEDIQQSCKALLPAGWKASEQKKRPGMASPPWEGREGATAARGPQQGLSVALFWFQVCIEALLGLPLQSASPCDLIAGFWCVWESLAKTAWHKTRCPLLKKWGNMMNPGSISYKVLAFLMY